MGEVYRARDTRLARDVALKILPDEFQSDPRRANRFEREARSASALNHPNIVAVYDVGRVDSVPYIAMELIEGRTLRAMLASGPIPVKQILEISCEVASGLARAHEAGIMHRDLKPENVMISKDGRAKILDFGLAKQFASEGGASDAETTITDLTDDGVVLGTVGYMSPEQAAGSPVDFRSDQFALGSMLYEMATGTRAFVGPSKPQTLAAIIEKPADSAALRASKAPLPLQWVIERCLAKDPKERYAATRDLAHDLSTVREHAGEISGTDPAIVAPRRLLFSRLWVPAAVLAGVIGVFFLGRRAARGSAPDYQRLTFRRGTVKSARFAPDGRTIVYGAGWEGDPIRLYSTRTDGRDSTRLDVADADVVSVSSGGEIAMLLGRPLLPINSWAGTLARAPLAGGAPREMTENVATADWSPDGKGLAIVRTVGKTSRLEFPIGKVLFETKGWIEALRFSPAGDRLAFLLRNPDVSVDMVDLAGKHSVLSHGWKRGMGLAWSPDGGEVWFSANERGWRTPIYAVTLAGKLRLVMRLPTWIELQDVSRDGKALVSLVALRWTTRGRGPGETQERDLSWHEGSLVRGLTPDGKTMLFDEGSEGYFHTIYVRPMDGSPAKRIGEGRAMAISPDGQWVAANAAGQGSPTVLLPTGAGEPRALESEGHLFEDAAFSPDGKRILLVAADPGHRRRSYVEDLPTGSLRAIAPEGVACGAISPDGREAACTGPKGEGIIESIDSGGSRPIPGFETGREGALLWSSDGRGLFVGNSGGPSGWKDRALRVFRLDLATGGRALCREIIPSDRAAFVGSTFAMTPDGNSYAYSFLNIPSDLYLVTGLK